MGEKMEECSDDIGGNPRSSPPYLQLVDFHFPHAPFDVPLYHSQVQSIPTLEPAGDLLLHLYQGELELFKEQVHARRVAWRGRGMNVAVRRCQEEREL